MKRRLRDAGILGRMATKKPYLRLSNKNKRLRWAKEHRYWTKEDWKKVLRTDKSNLLRCLDHKKNICEMQKNEKMLEECLTPSVKHGGGNVMVWGGFGDDKVGYLYRVKRILKKEGYHSIWQRHAIPCGRCLVQANFLLQ